MGKRILVCDDDPLLLEIVKFRLFARDFEVELATDGAEAIARIGENIPDAVVLDAMMPVMDGYQVLRKIRSNNAVKFTSEGLVSLAVAKSPAGGNLVRFTVTDTGVGIPLDRQSGLFQPFAQADASITRRFGGTGLGLSISKRLVELMGGEIGFFSNPGAGSSFWFQVNLPPAAMPDLQALPVSGTEGGTNIAGGGPPDESGARLRNPDPSRAPSRRRSRR